MVTAFEEHDGLEARIKDLTNPTKLLGEDMVAEWTAAALLAVDVWYYALELEDRLAAVLNSLEEAEDAKESYGPSGIEMRD